MHIDLHQPMAKRNPYSERAIDAAETVERATAAFQRFGLPVELELWDHGGFFWTAQVRNDFLFKLPPGARPIRVAGKGLSRTQCMASCLMELAERISLSWYASRNRTEHECLNLRTGSTGRIGAMDMCNTMCVSAGNNHEEAILHSLQELVETRLRGSCYWKPHKVLDFDTCMPELPQWLKDTAVVIKIPSDVAEFHYFTALRYRPECPFDERISDHIDERNGRLFFVPHPRQINHHSPNSGAAAALNPRMAVLRALNEIFQAECKDIRASMRQVVPAGIPLVDEDEMHNFETDSVTEDIRLMLRLLGEDVFAGCIDVTEPRLGIPVIKLVSDYDPIRSFASHEVMSGFYAIP